MRNIFAKKFIFFSVRIRIASSFVFGAILLAGFGFASGSGSAWSIVPSPNVTAPSIQYSNTYVHGLTCISASECWSVGYSSPYGYGSNSPFIGHWNGTSWSVAETPTINAYYPSLNGVTCASAEDCWAVGSYLNPDTSQTQTLVEHWDGAAWRVIASPNTSPAQSNSLVGAFCVSTSDCWAVGHSMNGSLVEHWDGTAWAIISSPTIDFAGREYLTDVTCSSTSDCWAAGRYFHSSSPAGYKTLLQHWDGSSWTIISSPNGNPSQFTDSYLNSVTCTSSSDCWSVGYSQDMVHGGYGALIEHWDGSSWAIVATNSPAPPVLNDVSCASASDCWTVGYASDGKTLVEHWDGNSWSIVSSPNGDPTQFNALYGVACLTGSNCWAAGQYGYYPGSVYQTLMEHWDGASWTIVPSANPNSVSTHPEPNQLLGTACVSEADCWAVGYSSGSNYETLVEHWNGKEWTIVNSPNTTSWSNQLNGVSCVSTSDCWAVGFIGGGFQTLIEHWDGTTWSIIASPNTNTSRNILYNVSCANASQCWAVGFAGSPSAEALIEQWNGTSWSIVASPTLPSASSIVLTGVTCQGSPQCWAVGYYQDSLSQAHHTLIQRWNGSSWVRIPSVDPGTQNYLSGVSCTSASDCWAIGSYWNGTTYEMLFERWNGSMWAVVPRTSSSSLDEFLSNITCASTTECWAVGYQNIRNSTRHPLIANWDGASWAITPAADSDMTQEQLLTAAACSSDFECWAVGYYHPPYPDQTLIERYDVPTVPSYTISVHPALSNGGIADGGGRYLSGADVTVVATSYDGYHFTGWTENGSIVSTSTSYEFTTNSDRMLVANFFPVVNTPVISPNGGTFKKKVNIKISCATPDATIYYTTDGTDPTTASNIIKKHKRIKLTGSGEYTVKAKAVKSGYDDSAVAVANFTITGQR